MDNDKPKTDAIAKLAPPQALALPTFRLTPYSLGEAMDMAKLITSSELCPQSYRGKPQDAILAYEFGAALGFSWMQSLKHVAVINGVTSIFGDAVPAIIYGSGQCERFYEAFEGKEYEDAFKAVLILKRKGYPDERRFEYSVKDAKVAKLWGKQTRSGGDTPWITNPKRMLRFRCLGFGARDVFADRLSGLVLAEEAMDYPDALDVSVVASEVVTESPLAKLPEVDREHLDKAFDLIHASPALQLQKVNEYLGGEKPDLAALLEWCRTEFAAQKGRTREKVKDTNGKAEAPTGSSTPAVNRVGPSGGELSDQSPKKAKAAVADLEF